MSEFEFQIREYQYQQDAVKAIVGVFNKHHKQPYKNPRRVLYALYGSEETERRDAPLLENEQGDPLLSNDEIFANGEIELSEEQLLENIREVQMESRRINPSETLENPLKTRHGDDKSCECHCSIDVDMETGTGKTFVYTKAIFELNKNYGWRKFIVVVPNIAIREGVNKSLKQTNDYFKDNYDNKYIDSFIYDSRNFISPLRKFLASDETNDDGKSIEVMIINVQAFNASMKRRIYFEQEEFKDQRPIDLIAATRPVVILDEPHRMGRSTPAQRSATQNGIRDFNPLFVMNFSATHRELHNLVYVLDARDAYEQKLVKKIRVKGFKPCNLPGNNGFVYLGRIMVYPDKAPKARITIEVRRADGPPQRESHIVKEKDDLYDLSKGRLSEGLDEYKEGYIVKKINPRNNTITFSDERTLAVSEVMGEPEGDELRSVQIEETIRSHFEKERELFKLREQGRKIKCLSLFFVDKVENYRKYDKAGGESKGVYGEMFEAAYGRVLEDYKKLLPEGDPYMNYLNSIHANETHDGYFAKDKTTKRFKDTEENDEDSVSAYELILKGKERLLSFEGEGSKTRFIFSHSALREGWDNPNVFQICTLKQSDSDINKRQEVGRGMRLCVSDTGERMDRKVLGEDVHKLNALTVIASESYEDFASDLQNKLKENLYERPTEATAEYFEGKIVTINYERHVISAKEAAIIYSYLLINGYIDDGGNVTDKYRNAQELVTLWEPIKHLGEDNVRKLIQGIYDKSVLTELVDNADDPVVDENNLNEKNFKSFEKLWRKINHKYAYKVSFEINCEDPDDLFFKKVNETIEKKLNISKLTYELRIGEQGDNFEFSAGRLLPNPKIKTTSGCVKYDLVGKIADACSLRRVTVCRILKDISPKKFDMFKINPDEFIRQVTKIIKAQIADVALKNIDYRITHEKPCLDKIFSITDKLSRAIKIGGKHITPYVFTDSNTEIEFAKKLNEAPEVCVFAKLPTSFTIPTLSGDYSPDWAVVFFEGKVTHVYFVAETKGSSSEENLRGVEKIKTSCAEKLFERLFSNDEVVYKVVANYDELKGWAKLQE